MSFFRSGTVDVCNHNDFWKHGSKFTFWSATRHTQLISLQAKLTQSPTRGLEGYLVSKRRVHVKHCVAKQFRIPSTIEVALKISTDKIPSIIYRSPETRSVARVFLVGYTTSFKDGILKNTEQNQFQPTRINNSTFHQKQDSNPVLQFYFSSAYSQDAPVSVWHRHFSLNILSICIQSCSVILLNFGSKKSVKYKLNCKLELLSVIYAP